MKPRTLDVLFSDYKWYRKQIGGNWVNVTPYFAWYISIWVRGTRCYSHERINATESYPNLRD